MTTKKKKNAPNKKKNSNNHLSQNNYHICMRAFCSCPFFPYFFASFFFALPLILGTFKKPAEHPINAPPGNVNFGMD